MHCLSMLIVTVKTRRQSLSTRISPRAPQYDLKVIGETEETGTQITFTTRSEIFTETTEYDYDILQSRISELSFFK